MWPDSNIGIATGSKAGLIVVDIDPRHGGDKSWEAWYAFNKVPNTLKVFTGGGGGHIYFSSTKIIKNRVGILPGVDIRGEDGYVVAPGSYHCSGKAYKWDTDPSIDQLAPLPECLEELIFRKKDNVITLHSNHIPLGLRNNTLASVAGLLRRHGLEENGVEQALSALNQTICATPLGTDEISAIAKSISKYESKVTAWKTLTALPKIDIQVPALSIEYIPDPLRLWMGDIAERMQVPIEFIAAPAIVGISSVVGRQIGIHPKQKDDWLVVPNLWGAIIARPGFFKSPAIAEALKPIDALTNKAQKEFESGKVAVKTKEEMLKAKIDGLKDSIKKITRKGNFHDVDPLRQDLEKSLEELESNVITEKRYKTNDATVEKLACLIKENPKGMLVLRDELSGWLKSLQKSGREGDREFYLESWNGYGSFTVDRIGRGTLHVPALCLSIFGGLQPSKIDAYLHQITNNYGDDGLLQRFQILVYPDIQKKWRNVDRRPNKEAAETAQHVFSALASLKVRNASEQTSLSGLHFSKDAQAVFDEWRLQLESRLRSPDSKSPVFESHLAKFRSLIPSLALIFHLIENYSKAALDTSDEIQVESIQLALKWAKFLENHAKKVYADILFPNLKAAHVLAKKITQKQVQDGDSLRSIYRRQWTLLRSLSELEPALCILEDAGWIKIENVKSGLKLTEVIRINPCLGSSELLTQFR
jgi:putative DNA primase/helicase